MARMKMKSELCVKKSIKVENKKFIIRIVFDEPTLRLSGGYDYSEAMYAVRIYRNIFDCLIGKMLFYRVTSVNAPVITDDVLKRIQAETYDYLLRKMNYYNDIKQMTEQLEESGWDCTLL